MLQLQTLLRATLTALLIAPTALWATMPHQIGEVQMLDSQFNGPRINFYDSVDGSRAKIAVACWTSAPTDKFSSEDPPVVLYQLFDSEQRAVGSVNTLPNPEGGYLAYPTCRLSDDGQTLWVATFSGSFTNNDISLRLQKVNLGNGQNTDITVDSNPWLGLIPQIEVLDQGVVIAFERQVRVPPLPHHRSIVVKKFNAEGIVTQQWTPDVSVDADQQVTFSPTIATNRAGRLAVSWFTRSASGYQNLRFHRMLLEPTLAPASAIFSAQVPPGSDPGSSYSRFTVLTEADDLLVGIVAYDYENCRRLEKKTGYCSDSNKLYLLSVGRSGEINFEVDDVGPSGYNVNILPQFAQTADGRLFIASTRALSDNGFTYQKISVGVREILPFGKFGPVCDVMLPNQGPHLSIGGFAKTEGGKLLIGVSEIIDLDTTITRFGLATFSIVRDGKTCGVPHWHPRNGRMPETAPQQAMRTLSNLLNRLSLTPAP